MVSDVTWSFLLMNSDEIVAQFKFTVLLMPNGPQKITGISLDPTAFQTENSITDEEIKKLITSSTRSKPNKKKKTATDGNKVSPIVIFDVEVDNATERSFLSTCPFHRKQQPIKPHRASCQLYVQPFLRPGILFKL